MKRGSPLVPAGSTTNIQYRPTGIELYITPQINEDGVVNLIIRQVLSSVDNSAAGVNNNPVFNNQEISTTVVVRNGENIVLGGLIQTDIESLNTGIPSSTVCLWWATCFPISRRTASAANYSSCCVRKSSI